MKDGPILVGECELRRIEGFSAYWAGSDGHIWSQHNTTCPQCGYAGPRPLAGRLIQKQRLYHQTTLRGDDGQQHELLVHRVICRAFHGAPRPGDWVRHLNGCGGDNRPDNLKWGTPKENEADKWLHGRRGPGSRNPGAKLNEAMVTFADRLRARHWRVASIARLFGVSRATVGLALRRKTWGHVPNGGVA